MIEKKREKVIGVSGNFGLFQDHEN